MKNSQKILLIDDLRNGGDPNLRGVKPTDIARTYWDGWHSLAFDGPWDLLLLDHDLGCFEMSGLYGKREKTGYDILCLLERYTYFLPKDIKVITDNASARPKMEAVVRKLYGRPF